MSRSLKLFSLLVLLGLGGAALGCRDDTSAQGGAAGTGATTTSSGGGGASGGSGGIGAAAGHGGFGGHAGEGGSVGGAAGTGGIGPSGGTGGAAGAGGGVAGAGGGVAGSGGSGGEATIVDGAADRVLLVGTVVTPSTTYDGQVLVEGDTITCAEAGTVCEGQPGASGATIITTHGIIAPGLIDTHNHILYDIFDEDDWVPHIPASCNSLQDCIDGSAYCSASKCDCVENVCRYLNHNNWTAEAEYGQMGDYKQCLEDASQGKPTWCPQAYDGIGNLKCEMDKWGELKGMIAGTTSIVGLPGTSSACFGSLSRSIDVVQNDLPYDRIQTSALFPPSSPDGVCANFLDGDTEAYLIHCGEGVNTAALDEFTTLYTITNPDGCLYAPQTAITHGTAYTATEFATMGTNGMKLTWSPASNVALYGITTDIPAALGAGLTISIAPDWSMGGSQNMLDELRFADAWDNARWGDVLSAQELVEMATINAARVLALEDTIGTIAVGSKADLLVVGGDTSAPYDAILGATPREVRLVMVGGVVLYGDDQLQAAGPEVPGCEAIDICGRLKFLCVAEDNAADKLNQTQAEIQAVLEQAFVDLDSLMPLDPVVDCTPDCTASQECYPRTNRPQVDASFCATPCCDQPATCDPLQACYQLTASTYGCQSVNACAPIRTVSFAPVSPLVKCP